MENNLTPTEIEELRIAIATEMGMKEFHFDPDDGYLTSGKWESRKVVLFYTTNIDSIREAAMVRFKTPEDIVKFEDELLDQYERTDYVKPWQLTAFDWCIAFARTAKIWRYKV